MYVILFGEYGIHDYIIMIISFCLAIFLNDPPMSFGFPLPVWYLGSCA